MVDELPTSGEFVGNRKPQVTIYDVAKLTGVSPSTVSRALSKPGRINVNTARRIREAADAIGYRINPLARALPTGRTGTFALILSDVTNPVYFDFVRGAQGVTAAMDNTLIFAESQESAEIELATAQRLLTSVDGLVLVGSRLSDESIQDLASRKPLILANRRVAGATSVVADVRPGLTDALDHLQALGHHRIAFIAGPPASWMNRHRWEATFELAIERGMSIVEIGPTPPTLEGGHDVVRRITASGVTAVVAYNDLIALGILRHARSSGIDVPAELSVIGFDDIFGADLTTPALSTIRSPLGELGKASIRLLAAEATGTPLAPDLDLITSYIGRESTAPPNESA